MITRIIAPFLVTLLGAYATYWLWSFLLDTERSNIALVVESESYAARSQLIRNVEAMLDALRDVQVYWTMHAHRPRAEWPPIPNFGVEKYSSIEVILWADDTRDARFVATAQNPVFDYRPSDTEWRDVQELLVEAETVVEGAEILGPYPRDSGHRLLVVLDRTAEGAVFIAVINANAAFAEHLRDVSPGYAVSVMWDDVILYRRGSPVAGVPEDWTHKGKIRTSMGTLWTVVHTPTADLADSLSAPALPIVLVLGFAVSALLGLLLFENDRVRRRAQTAEAAERKVAVLNTTLEQQVAHRTQELANRNTDLETITDSVAHDLRNPLNTISVDLQVLEQQFSDALGKDGMGSIVRAKSSVCHMASVIDRLVGLSIASHSTFHREPLKMKVLVAEVFVELQSAEPGPPVELILEDLPDVEADRTLVRILIFNLLSNAFRYTRDSAHRRIDVFSVPSDGTPTYCVRDNGIGLDSEQAKHMFHPVERLPDGRQGDGMVIGLAIVARVVERHQGRIWATGIKDKETYIYFTLAPEKPS